MIERDVGDDIPFFYVLFLVYSIYMIYIALNKLYSMRKLIDIPDEIVRELKVLAVKNDSDLKNYIQDVVSRHNEFSNLSELATKTLDDGQSVRAIWSYLEYTFDGIKNERIIMDEMEFTNFTEFLECVKMTCNMAIQSIKNDEECKADEAKA